MFFKMLLYNSLYYTHTQGIRITIHTENLFTAQQNVWKLIFDGWHHLIPQFYSCLEYLMHMKTWKGANYLQFNSIIKDKSCIKLITTQELIVRRNMHTYDMVATKSTNVSLKNRCNIKILCLTNTCFRKMRNWIKLYCCIQNSLSVAFVIFLILNSSSETNTLLP